MLLIRKSSPPNDFVEFKSQNPNVHFDDMPPEVKNSLRQSLLNEQGHLCAYCMCRIYPESSKMKIDHYKPRNQNNELDYKNLLAVCKGNEGEIFLHQHCDTRKKNLVLNINPQNESHIQQISYKPDGTIYSPTNTQFNDDLNAILNLNDTFSHLKSNRKCALDKLKAHIHKSCHNRTASLNFIRNLLQYYLEPRDGKLDAYCGIIIEYLQRKLRSWN